jgi:methylated-DNA-protein-cysteine methyltransferase-like protein
MRERLLQEGVVFKEEYTVDMEKHFWDPGDLEN